MKFRNIIIGALCATTLASCSDDFFNNPPQGVMSEEQLKDPANIDLLVSAAYATFSGRYKDSNDPTLLPITNWTYGEVRSDNAYKGGRGYNDVIEASQIETLTYQTNCGNLDGKWFQLYNAVSRCNSAINAIKNAPEGSYPNAAVRIAEMKVIRCHWYFELVRMFNMIPYMDEDVRIAEYVDVPNNQWTRDQHLGRLAGELLECSRVLPDYPEEVGRMSSRIACAYAAKIKLYQAYQQDPATHRVVSVNKDLMREVVSLIDGLQGYDLLDDFQKLDLVAYENGCESVMAIQYSMNDGSEGAGRVNWSNLLNSPGSSPYNGDGFFLPSQDLVNAYQTDANGLPEFDYQQLPDFVQVGPDANGVIVVTNNTHNVDPRLDFVIGRPGITWKTWRDTPCGFWVNDPDTYGYNCAKRFWVSPDDPDMYQGWPWGASALNWQLIRYADLLLYKAEALIEIGEDIPQAMRMINRVRQRAANSAWVKDFNDPTQFAANYKIGLYPETGLSQDYARKALRTEMRLEKALEGERFFDLVRWGIAMETMNNYFAAERTKRIYYRDAQFHTGNEYFPITTQQYEFSLRRYVQNPGYPAF